MTKQCTCKAEHWQPHADSCPAKVERPLLTLENIRSGAVPSNAVAVGFLLEQIEQLQKRLDRINDKWPHVTEVVRLNEALEKYGRHAHPNCYDLTLNPDGSFGPRNGCLCGFDAAKIGAVEPKPNPLEAVTRAATSGSEGSQIEDAGRPPSALKSGDDAPIARRLRDW